MRMEMRMKKIELSTRSCNDMSTVLKLSWKQCKFCGLCCRMLQVIECFNLKKKV